MSAFQRSITFSPPVRSRSLVSARKRLIVATAETEEVQWTLERTLTRVDDSIESPHKQSSRARRHSSNKVPGYAFFYFGSPRFEGSEPLQSTHHSDYSPLHSLQTEPARFELIEVNKDMKQCTVTAKLRKLRAMSRIRNRRIHTAQISKRQQLQEVKQERQDLMQCKEKRFEQRKRRCEIRGVGAAWLALLVGCTAIGVCSARYTQKVALKVKTQVLLKTFIQVAYCFRRLLHVLRVLREKRACEVRCMQALARIRPYVRRWIARRRRSYRSKVLQCLERALAEALLRCLMLKWVEAVRLTQIIAIQRAFRLARTELNQADRKIVKMWGKLESKEGYEPVEPQFKLTFVRVYRYYMRRQLRKQAQERVRLEASVLSSAVAHQISTKTATELIQAQSPRLAAALIATPALKQLSETQVTEVRKSCQAWLEHVNESGQQELTAVNLEKVLAKGGKSRERAKTSKSPRSRHLLKQQPLKCG